MRAKNLADPNVSLGEQAWPDMNDISPTTAAECEQDRLEPILKANAERHGADVRFNTELMDFVQDAQGITARIRDQATQAEETVYASYLIIADGVNGNSREKIGVGRHGPGVLQHWMNVIFETDMEPVVNGQYFTAALLQDINGTLVPRDDSGRWSMSVQYFPDHGEGPEDFNDEHCLQLIRAGVGREDVKARIVDARKWEVAAYVADRFSEGRAFIIGDAAHVMPPTGGLGGNTGIHDAHNLAWKLASVINGSAGPRLLDTYDSERRPVAEHTLAQALSRLQAWFKDPNKKLPPAVKIVEDKNVIFGYVYPSGALINEKGFSTIEAFEDPRMPSGCPGSRAAHLVVERNGERLSTIDICNGHWVLFAGPSGGKWVEAARGLHLSSKLGLNCYQFGPDEDLQDIDNCWSSAYGVSEEGAILIRPDGFIAWRAHGASAQPKTNLQNVLALLTFQNS
ncbi:2-polyprenyl-6-methoxyphenol hydroxylase-like FAD-dependent oxidoreductase [Ammoniphilus resinae]|uniref:2-polyprenyl-6-methoxyphenol hydroxylase-like FAD-dependent oxidoreductase n=1 Tax=Ammoniphilus resinae TaxID=861532 RepID=A0ABS4GXR5_9BACL|nr:2-polyprenyl-6-methoxyphenol hydroxylase-like FAD-dependent oxidoreductase [Ammoniphilus resinae]